MEDILKLLFLLQKVDSELGELEELKGDLPNSVNELNDKIIALKEELNSKLEKLQQTKLSREKADSEIVDFKSKLEKYKEQQYNVRNNREYDAITKEIEFANNKISDSEKIFLDNETQIGLFQTEIEELNSKLESLESEFKIKKDELEIISKENEDEVISLQNERSKIVVRLDEQYLNQYERIRSGRNGKAVVAIRKDTCGGCNNRIPPQHLIELELNEKIYFCEHCGRIVLSANSAETASSVMQN